MKLDLGRKRTDAHQCYTGFQRKAGSFDAFIDRTPDAVLVQEADFERADEGTWMGHGVIEHIALKYKHLPVWILALEEHGAQVKKANIMYVSYMEEDAGVYAAKAAVRIAHALIFDEPYNMDDDIQNLREIREDTVLGSVPVALLMKLQKEAYHIRLNKHSLVQLGYGVHQKRIRGHHCQHYR